jgi:hypothetical protein
MNIYTIVDLLEVYLKLRDDGSVVAVHAFLHRGVVAGNETQTGPVLA